MLLNVTVILQIYGGVPSQADVPLPSLLFSLETVFQPFCSFLLCVPSVFPACRAPQYSDFQARATWRFLRASVSGLQTSVVVTVRVVKSSEFLLLLRQRLVSPVYC